MKVNAHVYTKDIEAALNAVQAFADAFFLSGGGGWEAAETALRRLTPAGGHGGARGWGYTSNPPLTG